MGVTFLWTVGLTIRVRNHHAERDDYDGIRNTT